MNIIDDVRIKQNITATDYKNVIETIVSFVIRKEDNGDIEYTPYYRNVGEIVAVCKVLLTGITYDKDDDIYEEYINNNVISIPVDEFISKDMRMAYINENVSDIVEFNKQKYINDFSKLFARLEESLKKEHMLYDLNLKIAKKQNTLLTQQIKANEYNDKVAEYMSPEETATLSKKMLSGEFNIEQIMNIAMEKYINSDIHKEKEKDLIDSLSNKVKSLQEYKNLNEARNVLSDK